MTLVIAHRGASVEAPENTMPAFELAVRRGADAIELDVHLTADGELAVIHDETLDRTTDRGGPVSALTMDDIRAADAGATFPGEDGTFPYRGSGIRVPSLAEVLDWLPERIGLVVEVKDPAAVDATVRVLLQHPSDVHRRASVISFHEAAVERSRALAPGIATGILLVPFADFAAGVRYAAAHGHTSINPWEGDLGADAPLKVADAVAYGLRVGCYVVNDVARMRQLADADVSAFVTDRPDLGRAALDERTGR